MTSAADVEVRLSAAENRSIRAEQASTAATNGLLNVEQGLGSIVREIKTMRREMTVGFTSMRGQITEIKTRLPRPIAGVDLSLTPDDFQETPTGSFKVSKAAKEAALQALGEIERDRDARKWRRLWHRVKWFVFVVIGGAGGLAGERLLAWLWSLGHG